MEAIKKKTTTNGALELKNIISKLKSSLTRFKSRLKTMKKIGKNVKISQQKLFKMNHIGGGLKIDTQ